MSLSSVAISASARAGKKSEKDADIIEFVESSWGLKMTLFPVQRVILKAHYGLELDDVETFQISDWTRTKVETHTEKSYLKKLFDEGRCNIGEVIPGKQRREMILSIGRRSGKCVTGDTLIPTDKGLVRIDSLGDSSLDAPEYQKISVKVVQEGGKTARAAYFYNGGIKPTFKLETESGYTLEGTGNHRIKVLDKNLNISWKYLENIEEGDVACLNHKRSIFTDQYVKLNEYTKDLNPNKRFPEYLTKDWGEMLGILAGDGSWSEENCIVVTVGDNSFKENLVLTMLSLFGKVAEIPQKNKNCSKIAVYDKNFRKFMHNLGWKIKAKYKDKCIPDIVLRSPRDVQCAFVRGLFETDGSVSRDRRDVSFTTKSELLGKQVQTLLLSLGVFSSRKETIRDGKPYYRVRLKKWASYRIFHKDIGFISKEKREKLDSLAKRMTSTPKSNEIGLPPRVSSYLNDYEDLGLRQKSTRLEKIRGIIEEGNISEASVLKLNGILDKDYIFEPIKRVEESENHVFDLNVPDGSMFVGNGFTNHNTTISACIAAYETYKLIKKENPQRFYGLPASNNIQIISVATDKDQAGLLYQEVSGHYRNCAFFGPYTANNTLSYARFQTPADVEKYGRYIEDPSAKATLKVTFRSCVAKGLRGAGNICVILDEVAHFTETGQSGAEEVYNAVVPSTSAYSAKDPEDPTKPIGEVEGRVILISSPLGRQGLFYNLFQIGMRGGAAADNILAVQAPTWEVNPTVPAQEFEKHYLKNAAVFFTEYGGEFTDRTRGWIEKEEDLLACVDPSLSPKRSAPARKPHFVGIDLALVGDGTAIAIGHLEDDMIVLDLVDQIKAGEGIYHDKERLEFDDVADWVLEYSKKFFFTEGIFDQWAGIPFQQALEKRGLKQLTSVNMTKQITSNMFQNFKDMMWDKKLKLYNKKDPYVDGHEPYIAELLELQQTVHSKHLITVEAPQTAGKHDDMSDALVRMIWLASNSIGKTRYFAQGSRGGSHPLAGGKSFATGGRYTGRGGSDSKRIAPKRSRYDLRGSINGRYGKK